MFKVNNKDVFMFKVNNKDVFIVNFEHISHLVLMFLLLALSRSMPAGDEPESTLFSSFMLILFLQHQNSFMDHNLVLAIGHPTQNWSFPLMISLVNVIIADLVTFTEEILNGKLHFLCSVKVYRLPTTITGYSYDRYLHSKWVVSHWESYY